MSPSDQVFLFVCLRRVLLLYVAISAVAGGQNITEVVVGDEVVHAITKLQVGGGVVDSARTITDVDGGDVCHRKVHSITEEDGRADDEEAHAITNEGAGTDDDGSDGKLSSASLVLYAARAEANTAAAGKWRQRMPTALPELNSDDGRHGQQFDRTVDQIQSSIADRLIATTMIVMLMVFMINGRRASERKKRSGRATWFSPAAALTMLLLVVAASANSSTAVRPLPASAAAAGGHNEAAAASGTMPLKAAAPGHSSCTTDPNTQQPVRCIPH